MIVLCTCRNMDVPNMVAVTVPKAFTVAVMTFVLLRISSVPACPTANTTTVLLDRNGLNLIYFYDHTSYFVLHAACCMLS